jgi:hypothetical protein
MTSPSATGSGRPVKAKPEGRAEHPRELRRHVRGARGPRGRIFGEQPGDEIHERRGRVGARRRERRRLFEEHLGQHGQRVAGGERRLPGEALEQHRAEREQIRSGVDLLRPARLLRGHIPRGADHRVARRARERLVAVMEPRDAEIEDRDLRRIAAAEEQVRGLDVAVDDPARVRGREPLGDAEPQGDALGGAERAAPEAVAEVFSFDPLHREERLVVGRVPVVDVPDDGGVIERGERRRLCGEAAVVLRILGHGGGQDLERDLALSRSIFGDIDLTHPPGAEPRDDLERAELLPGGAPLGLGRRRLGDLGDRADERVDPGRISAVPVLRLIIGAAHGGLSE